VILGSAGFQPVLFFLELVGRESEAHPAFSPWERGEEAKAMVMTSEMVEQCLKIIPAVKGAPQKYLWSSYDAEADVLYINFKKPRQATDSELTENNIIIRHEGEEIVGLTVLHASKR
jgi:uncharacterized protein YuzE